MVEMDIVQWLVSGGLSTVGGGLAAYFYTKWQLSKLQQEIDQMREERHREMEELKDVGEKLDKLLEYMPILRTLEKSLHIKLETN